MFSDLKENKKKLQGAYRKLKSYYYFNKDFLTMRKKIAEFENNEKHMEQTFDKLSKLLKHTNAHEMNSYLSSLLKKIEFYALPKQFETEQGESDILITNVDWHKLQLKSINFFINAPIEIHILDTLWTVFLGKMDYDKGLLSHNVYGNTINKSAIYTDDDTHYESRILFNRYFDKYTQWRNGAFDTIEHLHRFKQDTLLISLDIRSFYYSVSFPFIKLSDYFEDHSLLKKISSLTNIVESVYATYFDKIKPYRCDMDYFSQRQYPLPIGLLSSTVLANIYLKDFDDRIAKLPNMVFYGRYVDDLLFVVSKTVNKKQNSLLLLDEIFVMSQILEKKDSYYVIKGLPNLQIKYDKIKLLYFDHKETKAFIDRYNKAIKIYPSQMFTSFDDELTTDGFDESAYLIDGFSKEKKIRDIESAGFDAFKIKRYFSSLPRKYSKVNTKVMGVNINIKKTINQIERFFGNCHVLEYPSQWLDYMYFLVLTEQNEHLQSFYSKTKIEIRRLKSSSLDETMYANRMELIRKVKDFLLENLNIGLHTALCIDFLFAKKHFIEHISGTSRIEHSNMFDHRLVMFPLANYFEHTQNISLCKMSLNDISDDAYIPEIEKSFKFVWSPRFIHYDELLLMHFYRYHNLDKRAKRYKYDKSDLVKIFLSVNHIRGASFDITTNQYGVENEYKIQQINIPTLNYGIPYEVYVAIGSVNISEEKCARGCKDRWANITFQEKELFFNILKEAYNFILKKRECGKRAPMFLVMPELCFPVYWIGDLAKFAKQTQIGIITGLQYVEGCNKEIHNYIATFLPFVTGKKKYRNTFVYIREKNDYSPIEFKALTEIGLSCANREVAEYQVYNWNDIRIAPILCFEFTDVMVRALLKGHCDFVATSVYNPDTTYFSNIIDSTVRDIHAFVVQANTAQYGDSRVTGPYDRDSKDIFKIKGGENDHIIIGRVDFGKYKKFQENYQFNFNKKFLMLKKNLKLPSKQKEKPDLKPFPARFKNKK